MQPLMEMPYGFSLSYASICQSAFRTFAVILPAPQTPGTPLLHTLRIKQLDQLSYCILRHNITFMYCMEVQPSVSLHLPISHVKPDSEIQFCQIIYTSHWIQCRPLERLLSFPTNFNCILDISSLMSTLKSTNRD